MYFFLKIMKSPLCQGIPKGNFFATWKCLMSSSSLSTICCLIISLFLPLPKSFGICLSLLNYDLKSHIMKSREVGLKLFFYYWIFAFKDTSLLVRNNSSVHSASSEILGPPKPILWSDGDLILLSALFFHWKHRYWRMWIILQLLNIILGKIFRKFLPTLMCIISEKSFYDFIPLHTLTILV